MIDEKEGRLFDSSAHQLIYALDGRLTKTRPCTDFQKISTQVTSLGPTFPMPSFTLLSASMTMISDTYTGRAIRASGLWCSTLRKKRMWLMSDVVLAWYPRLIQSQQPPMYRCGPSGSRMGHTGRSEIPVTNTRIRSLGVVHLSVLIGRLLGSARHT